MFRRTSWRWMAVRVSPLALLLVWATNPATGQSGGTAPSAAKVGEWLHHGADLFSTRYSPLDQINAANFNSLEVAWQFKTDSLGPRPSFSLQATPLMANGVLYLTAGARRAVVALDAATGEMLWMHSEQEGKRGENAPRAGSGRGLAYWSDGKEGRILYVTPGHRLVALDAKTGIRVPSFGKDGVVDLKLENDQQIDLIEGNMALNATPTIAKGVVVVGFAGVPSARQRAQTSVKGNIRGFDVRTGKRLWIFHTIPSPGEFGNETWVGDDWARIGNTGSWSQMSVDEELGLLYVPVEAPTGDHYGGHRRGSALFGESLVALDILTGKRRWHFQLEHHGLWDHDLPAAPILADITVDGRMIKAVALPTKQAWLYVFDRVTGQPVWPIEERPVPQGDVPGEWYSPTQPFVTKPPAYDRQGVTVDDLIDFTPELRAEALKIVSKYKMGPLFSPPIISKWDGPRALLMLPSNQGGTNWPGGSFDPETGIAYVYSHTDVYPIALVRQTPRPGEKDALMEYNEGIESAPTSQAAPARGGGGGAGAAGGGGEGGLPGGRERANTLVQGLPLIKPPYGRITALDLNRGEIAWQIAHGETPDNIKNHPALKGLTIPRTGRVGRIGTLVTKTLVIAGEGGLFTTPSGQRGAMLRAYDKATGEEKGAVYMPAAQTGSPMTYMLNGTQYIAVSIGGGAYSGTLMVFKLGT